MRFIFTSEAVTEGHPDKVADRIADSILDEILKQDKNARVACEVIDAPQLVFIFGEITTTANVDYEKVARDTVKEIGYTNSELGFDYENMKVIVRLNHQSENIAQGVNKSENKDLGAGDQGIMFGYATKETEEYLPLPIYLAQKLALRLAYVRKNNIIPYLRPDGKTQVSVEYDGSKILRVDTVLISAQHNADVDQSVLKNDIIENVIKYVIPSSLLDDKTKILINPTGIFEIGGPAGDTGLTGRKLIVDTYGGASRHGGGSFSGKDATKVDRSASYMARYAAKNIVAAGLCDRCEIQLSYAIGVSKPVSIYVNTFGTSKYSDEEISNIVDKVFDFTPAGIIKKLDLNKPIYKSVSCYGHFGRSDLDLPWERLDKVEEIKKLLK